MMEQCKEKLSIAMFTGQNQLRSDGLWWSKRSIGGTLVDLPIFLDN